MRTREAEFRASLVYRVSSSTARATERNFDSEKQDTNTNNQTRQFPGVVVHAFDLNTQEAEADRSLSSRTAWYTE